MLKFTVFDYFKGLTIILINLLITFLNLGIGIGLTLERNSVTEVYSSNVYTLGNHEKEPVFRKDKHNYNPKFHFKSV